MQKKTLTIFGARPEAIKMAPLILEAKEACSFDMRVRTTGQHNEIFDQVLDFLE